MTKKDPTPTTFSMLFETMVGSHVRILTNIMTKEHRETEDGSLIRETLIAYEGIMVIEDDEYFYLGPDNRTVSHAVKKSYIVSVEAQEFIDEDTDLLLNMPDPKKKEEIN